MSDVVIVAVIAAVPLTITAVYSIIGARSAGQASRNSVHMVNETRSNGGSTIKDDLIAVRLHLHSLSGTVSVLTGAMDTHLRDTAIHEADRMVERAVVAADLMSATKKVAEVADDLARSHARADAVVDGAPGEAADAASQGDTPD